MFKKICFIAMVMMALVITAQAQAGTWSAGLLQNPPAAQPIGSGTNIAALAASFGFTLLNPLTGSCSPVGAVRMYYTVDPAGSARRYMRFWRQTCNS